MPGFQMSLLQQNLSNNKIRIVIAFVAALCVSLVLFYIMNMMITSDRGVSKLTANNNIINFIRLNQESAAQKKNRRRIKKKIEKREVPDKLKISLKKNILKTNLDFTMPIPKLSSLDIQGSPAIGEVGNKNTDGILVPVTRIAPQYPRKAARKRIEGWVEIEFSVLENGTVNDIKVIASKPRRVFNRAAIKAISKWKFKPLGADISSVKRFNQIIEFKLKND